ncbi:SPOR domain-containing protein [Pseudodesulfovibrio sp.]|uniref:SPOR domain-containing protein n=1 Tax=unclassified Pseudodesulfovibrio TaxID=2661612 RepID=UPI003AFF6532
MTHIHRNILTTTVLALFGLLLLGGCFRQHIESTPPGATPATRPGTASASSARPAAAPKVVNDSNAATARTKEPSSVIEETYVVDAPKDTVAPAPKIEEEDLAAEPAPAKPVAAAPAQVAPAAVPAAKPAPKPIAPEADAAVADVATPDVMADMFYIQVGSFSELDNANKVLASLIEQGYDGSRLSMTDEGQFRVQAGAFTDKVEARKALDSLTTKFKGAYILRGTPQ